jgi:hypothetical protein
VLKGPDPFLAWLYGRGFFSRGIVLIRRRKMGWFSSPVFMVAIVIIFITDLVLLRVHSRVLGDVIGRDVLLL